MRWTTFIFGCWCPPLRPSVQLLLALAFALMHGWLGLLTWVWLLLTGWGIALWHGLRSRKSAVRRAMALEMLRAQAVDLVAGQTDLLMAGQLPAQMQKVLNTDAACR